MRSTAIQGNLVDSHYYCRDLQKSTPLLHPRTRLHHKSHHTPFVKRKVADGCRSVICNLLLHLFRMKSKQAEKRESQLCASRKTAATYQMRVKLRIWERNSFICWKSPYFGGICRRSTTVSKATDTIHKRANVAYCFTVVRAQKRLTHITMANESINSYLQSVLKIVYSYAANIVSIALLARAIFLSRLFWPNNIFPRISVHHIWRDVGSEDGESGRAKQQQKPNDALQCETELNITDTERT